VEKSSKGQLEAAGTASVAPLAEENVDELLALAAPLALRPGEGWSSRGCRRRA
jgi:hypothetical protein